MPHHRRAVLSVLAAAIVALASLGVASAAGPGGWDHLGDGGTPGVKSLDATVSALSTDAPGLLLVGGSFNNAGGIADADRIGGWNGSAWSAVGPGLGGSVMAITSHGGKVYAGGTFTDAGGNQDADHLAVWDGLSWTKFCNAPGAPIDGNVTDLQIIGTKLYIGGNFQNGAGFATADYLVACDLTDGTPTSLFASDGDGSIAVNALAADSAGVLYVGGSGINLAGIPAADYVAAWDGAWHAVGSGASPGGGPVTGIVRALTAKGTDVYVGTDANDIAQIPQADHVAKWNGSSWSALGSNAAGDNGWFPSSTFINGMTTSGTKVFATGSFQNANGEPTADVVAYFDGFAWHPLGSNGAGDGPLTPSAQAVAVLDNRLYAGGSFTSAGGDSLASFAASFALSQVEPVATPTVTPAPAPTPVATPTVTPAPSLPPPKFASTVNAAVESGTVLVAEPAKSSGATARASAVKFVKLTGARQLPLGTTFDTTRGTLHLTFAGKQAGTTLEGSFSKGRFTTAQAKGDGLVTLSASGGNFKPCKTRLPKGGAAKAVTRSLLSKVRGRFRTRGRNSSATGRTATWLQTDTCASTVTAARAGTVTVRDFVKRRNATVKKGKRYTARAKRR